MSWKWNLWRGNFHLKKLGMLVVLLGDLNLGFWSHLEWSVHDDSWNTAFLDSKVSLRVHWNTKNTKILKIVLFPVFWFLPVSWVWFVLSEQWLVIDPNPFWVVSSRAQINFRATPKMIFLGWKFLKKLWCCVGGGNKVIWLYQLSWKCKLATVTSYKADISSVGSSSDNHCRVSFKYCDEHPLPFCMGVPTQGMKQGWWNIPSPQ